MFVFNIVIRLYVFIKNYATFPGVCFIPSLFWNYRKSKSFCGNWEYRKWQLYIFVIIRQFPTMGWYRYLSFAHTNTKHCRLQQIPIHDSISTLSSNFRTRLDCALGWIGTCSPKGGGRMGSSHTLYHRSIVSLHAPIYTIILHAHSNCLYP